LSRQGRWAAGRGGRGPSGGGGGAGAAGAPLAQLARARGRGPVARRGSGQRQRPGGQQRGEGGGRARAGEVVALGEGTAQPAQPGRLVRRLHPLGDDRQPERVRQADDRPDDRGVVGVRPQPGDEGPVDLEGVDREALEVGQVLSG